MARTININPATETDIENLVEISIQAEKSDKFQSLVLAQATEPIELRRQWTRVSLNSNLQDTRARLFKAILQETKEIFGYGVLYFYPANWTDEGQQKSASVDGINKGLLDKYWDLVNDLQKKALCGRAHYVWSFPQILPDFQHQGLEEEMMRLAILHYGLDKEVLWTRTDESTAVEILKRLGWHKVESAILDISPWQMDHKKHSDLELVSLVRQPGRLEA